jgi:NADH:ubiquinone oxidoreductase subunit H
LVLAVILVHALFLGGYHLFLLEHASPAVKIGYTVAWTAVTLLVVLRGLVRIRALRARDTGHAGVPRG